MKYEVGGHAIVINHIWDSKWSFFNVGHKFTETRTWPRSMVFKLYLGILSSLLSMGVFTRVVCCSSSWRKSSSTYSKLHNCKHHLI